MRRGVSRICHNPKSTVGLTHAGSALKMLVIPQFKAQGGMSFSQVILAAGLQFRRQELGE